MKNKEVIVKNFDDPVKLFVFLIEDSSFESSINLREHFIEELQEIIHIMHKILYSFFLLIIKQFFIYSKIYIIILFF